MGDGGGSYAYLKYCFGNDMMYLGVCVVKSGLKSDGAVYDGVKLEISSSKLRGVCEIRYDGKILSNSISILESGAAYSEISGIYCIEFALPLSEIAYYSEEFDVRVTVVSTELDSSSYGEAVIFKSITHTIRYEDEHVLLPVHETEYEPEDNASSKAESSSSGKIRPLRLHPVKSSGSSSSKSSSKNSSGSNGGGVTYSPPDSDGMFPSAYATYSEEEMVILDGGESLGGRNYVKYILIAVGVVLAAVGVLMFVKEERENARKDRQESGEKKDEDDTGFDSIDEDELYK